MERVARALQLRKTDPSPCWFQRAMLVVGCLILISTPFYMLLLGPPDLFNVGGIGAALAFLLILGADKLSEPRGMVAAAMRLVGMILMAAGMMLALGSIVGGVL